ncbi:porin [Pseudoalteromonas xiamenensis]|uniref:porin n=1 Tax=Pseudoalteromonas xiamenensis TaxID=882626 RepID=UPI0027E4254A|nr:porin [Pseudoalteromonas xiamenensis]WMN59586.1 porin [Pseudoalteromonas xiamenensis]
MPFSRCNELLLLCCLSSFTVSASSTERPVTMADIEALEAQLAELKARLQAQQVQPPQSASSTASSPQTELTSTRSFVDLYATIRPTFGYLKESGGNNWDVRDALSHAGFKVTHEFMPDWQVELQGEWGIDLANEGNFGKSRRAYTALKTPYGRFGIGKQRPAQYLFIADPVDIFNHSSSPFSYDPESLFFVDNLLSYRFEYGPLTFIAVGQFDGQKGDDQNDMLNAGLSYDANGLHAAVTYQQSKVYEADTRLGENQIWAGALAYQFTDRFYAAVAYQDKTYQRLVADLSRDGHTFDLSLAYQLSPQYKLKAGIFDFEDGYASTSSENQSFDGYNVTLEWLPIAPLRVHLEYLSKSFVNDTEFDSISIGFRYDFKQQWSFK